MSGHFKNQLMLLVLVLLHMSLHQQVYAQDSIQVLTLQDLHQRILQHHPVAAQAALLTSQARQELRIARGSLDPVISSKLYQKTYGGKDYYQIWNNTLQIPTWFGPEFRAGYDQNRGQYLNPENSTPAAGLSFAGISVPLGQGLFIDQRRAVIRQAALLQDMAEAERVKLINKLLLQATKDYWDWLQQYRDLQLFEEALALAHFRLKAVRERVRQGDLAAIDTVEAKMEVQNRQVLLQQAQLAYNNGRLVVSTHLWAAEAVPLELREGTIPVSTGSELKALSQDSLQQLLGRAKINHPDLRKLAIKGQQLQIEQRFAADKLKPKLNVEYNVLQRDFYLQPYAFDQQYLGANYKLGMSFSLPLFLREERGKLQLTKAKQQANTLEQVYASREVENNLLAAYNEWQALEAQIRVQEQMVANAGILRQGELIRFQNGESSLFLVNSRELKLLEAQQKLNALKAKYAKVKTLFYWSAGEIRLD